MRPLFQIVPGFLSLFLQGFASPEPWQDGPGFRYRDLLPAPPAAPAPANTVGFSELPGSLTGLTFQNELPVRLMMENNNLMNGSGLAAGDFDGDGWCDLYFCAIQGTNALYRNLGHGRFALVTNAPALGLPERHSTGASFADLDGDGDLDLLVSTLGSGVHAFRSNGHGRFDEITAESNLTSDTGSMTLALGDVDGDGDLDLYVANYGTLSLLRSGGGRAEMKQVNGQWVFTGPYAKRLRMVDGRLEELGEPDLLYLNDGHGRFRAVPWNSEFFLDEQGAPKAEPWDFGLTAQIRDLNDDGAPDIYVCNDFQTVDRIWLNDRQGRFRALPRLALRKQCFASMGVDFSDLDRDGALDFIVVEMMARPHAQFLREVTGLEVSVPVPGRLDNRPEVVRNTLFRNRGDHTYAEIAHYSGLIATDWTWQPVFLDVDLDGYEDLLVGNGMSFNVQDRDALARVRSLGRQTPEQARTNLLLYPPHLSPNYAFRNRGDLTFDDASAAWNFHSHRISQGFALADFDHDGDLDVAINCLNAPALLYRNDAQNPRLVVRLKGNPPNTQAVGARLRVRGGPVALQTKEILCGGRYLSGDDTVRTFAAGSPTNRLTIEVLWRSGKQSLVRDAQPNRLYEINEPTAPPQSSAPDAPSKTPPATWFVDASDRLKHTHHEVWFNDYARQPLLMKQLSQLGPGVAWCDLNGDQVDELILGTGQGGVPAVFQVQDRQQFVACDTTRVPALPDDLTGLAGWARADGRRALLAGLANYESPKTNLPTLLVLSLEGGALTGDTLTIRDPQPPTHTPGPIAVADIDGDGDLDVFVGSRVIPGLYPQPANSHLLRQENGSLVADPASDALLRGVGLVSGARWSDLNADGFPELILACEWGPIRLFQNHGGRLADWNPDLASSALRIGSFRSLTGWWNGIATGDFDGDGRLDIVASNWGLNTGYSASADHPVRLYYGALGGSGTFDLVEAQYVPDLDAELPRRSLNALSQALPFLLEHCPTHETYSTTRLPDILALCQTAPQVAQAVTLHSLLLLNRGTHFVVSPLPTEAQLAPAFSVNVADADGDGNEDLFLSQNFFANRPELPRYDAGRGLWLRGDGAGSLVPVPGQTSGVRVYGEQRGAALGDFNEDGRIDLVLSQNGAPTALFENTAARPGLRVRLNAGPGNPTGVGALLRLRFGQSLGPAREVHAGSGYWSQDSAIQVMATPQPPTALWVRWPGGKLTQTALPPDCYDVSVDSNGQLRIKR